MSYYGQAARGHFALLAAARPIGDWIDNEATPATLKNKLALARQIRAFAVSALALPDNGSYTRYADLKRPAAVWNVFATPELSLQLKTWCYPVIGCAGYRGYFDRAEAERLGAELRAQRYDVNVAPVPAYSTLGWFDDPLLSTFIYQPDGELARLIFHELAHQVAYADGDTVFNESFATAVERIGVQRWLDAYGTDRQRADYAQLAARRERFLRLLLDYRSRLARVFAADIGDDAKRAAKKALFEALQSEYQYIRREEWNGFPGYDRFFSQELNGAHLAAISAYNELVPAFERLLAGQGGDLRRFYDEVKRIAALPKPQRRAALLESKT